MHVKIAVAVKKSEHDLKQIDDAVISILCERIPDLFDYIDDDNMERITVSQFQKRKNLIQTLYGYFDKFACYSTNLSDAQIQNGLLYDMNELDYIYIVDCHI